MFFTRYLLSMVLATVVTFILFAIMIAMIKIGQHPVTTENLNLVNFIQTKQERNLNLEQVKPEPPPMPKAPPTPVQMQMPSINSAPQKFDAGTGVIAPQGISIQPGYVSAEGGSDYLPIAQIAPQYPRSALYKGIEGWVLVQFTIGTQGQVKDAHIVKSDPPGVFDKAALDAVKRFRFKPRMIGNTAVEVTGVENRIRFRLESK